MGEIWALMILQIADEPLLPFSASSYSTAVQKYIEDLHSYISSQTNSQKVDLSSLTSASHTFSNEAHRFDQWSRQWSEFIMDTQGFDSSSMGAKRLTHNDHLADLESHLLDLDEGGGLPNRTQFKHVIFAPQAWSGYDEAFFPGVRDAVDEGNWDLAQVQVEKVARILKSAAEALNR